MQSNCWAGSKNLERHKIYWDLSQLPGRLFSPSDVCKKQSHYFLLHFQIGMGSYDHQAKDQGVFP